MALDPLKKRFREKPPRAPGTTQDTASTPCVAGDPHHGENSHSRGLATAKTIYARGEGEHGASVSARNNEVTTMWNSQSTLADRFDEGLRLAKEGNFSDALVELVACVSGDPAQFDYVDAFLATIDAVHRKSPPPIAQQLPEKLAPLVAQENWEAVVKSAPACLVAEPGNAAICLALGTACEKLGADEVAVLWNERVRRMLPDSHEAIRGSARQWERLGMTRESLESWSALVQHLPDDEEAANATARLLVAANRSLNGLDNAAPTPVQELLRRPRREFGVAAATQDGNARDPDLEEGGLLTPIQRLERSIRDQPTLPDAYLKLAPLYIERGREYDAEKMLSKARDATNKDPRIIEMWEDVAMARYEKRVALARQTAREQPGDGTKSEYDQAVKERDQFETDIFIARCKRYPDRASMRLELGRRLHRAGDTAEACDHFAAAMADPQLKAEASLELGQCRRELGDYPTALSHFRQASEAAVSPEAWETKRKALMEAGKLALAGGLNMLARRYLNQILKNDPYDQLAQSTLREIATG